MVTRASARDASAVVRRIRPPHADAATEVEAEASVAMSDDGKSAHHGFGGSFQKGKRSISTDSFLREPTPTNLPARYYARHNRTPLNLAVSIGGVLGSLCVYGVLQERLMTIPYGGTTSEPEKAEMFTSSVFLVLMNRLVTVVVSAVGIVLTGDSFRTSTPLNLYASIAFSNLVTTVCQYEVLKYLSFAASTLAKCAKIIPVMVWGRMILHKRYTWLDYVMAATVTAGCFLFVMDRGVINDRQLRHERQATHGGVVDDTADGTYNAYSVPAPPGEESAGDYEEHSGAQVMEEIVQGGGGKLVDDIMQKGEAHMYVLGTIIMCVYLGFDGFTSTFQQKLYRHYTCSILNQIFFTTCFSAVFSTAWLLSTAQMAQVWGFMGRHPGVIQDIFVLSVSAAVSQFAISYTIFCFGAVTLASVMTFRQFISVVISCFLFGNPLSGLQWVGVAMVLAPVFERAWQEWHKPSLFGQAGDEVDESPRAGMGYGPPPGQPGGIPENYFSARGTGHTPRHSGNFDHFSPRSSENFSPRSSLSEGVAGGSSADERSKLLRK